MVEDELNVDRVEATGELGDVLAYELVPNFKLLGPRLKDQVQELAHGVADGDALVAGVLGHDAAVKGARGATGANCWAPAAARCVAETAIARTVMYANIFMTASVLP